MSQKAVIFILAVRTSNLIYSEYSKKSSDTTKGGTFLDQLGDY